MNNIGESLQFATSQSTVDSMNAEFYGNIKFPWPPMVFEKVCRKDFWTKMISQDLGYWNKSILPQHQRIWVAGCGTNQALFTALKFPDARIIGSDLSQESLLLCEKNAKQLGVQNLELRLESINDSSYKDEFDYIISTGVVHHNAEPHITLHKLSTALKPLGIMEFMVYNKFHRICTSAFQSAVRIFTKSHTPNITQELPIAKKMINDSLFVNQCKGGMMQALLEEVKFSPDAAFADSLLQPVEHSYTIESLESLLLTCNLELLSFCLNQFNLTSNNFNWNLLFQDKDLQNLYYALPDTKRWQITNLLRGENSPMLWFYLQQKGCPRIRKSEQQICQEFLNTKFKRITEEKLLFPLQKDGTYDANPTSIQFPAANKFYSQEVKEIYNRIDENKNIGKVFEECGISQDFANVNIIRLCLTTSSSPLIETAEFCQ